MNRQLVLEGNGVGAPARRGRTPGGTVIHRANSDHQEMRVDGTSEPAATEAPALAADSTGATKPGRAMIVAELLTAFAIGVAVMSFIFVNPRGGGRDAIGVSGFDSFYHTKMSAMIPEVGLLAEFPWLRFVYFSPTEDGFISHHYGFHVLILPFVQAGRWLVDDALTGGRWAVTFFCGINLLLFHALLIHGGVRWRWLWTVIFLLLPGDYFLRHSYVRAIGPSLMFVQLIVLFMFQQRWRLTALAIVGYCHLYLGSIVYTPVIVGLYVAASMIAPRGERSLPWRLILWAVLGWLVGLRTYPYFDGALEFLRMQILGSGLSPDIAVGSEWNSYGNVWQFAVVMCGPVLAAWSAALALRLGMGPRLDRRELALVLLHFAFLVLTLKARRFIEYWPLLCLLSAAYLAAPVLNPIAAWFDPTGPRAGAPKAAGLRLLIIGACASVVIAAIMIATPRGIDRFVVEWPIWLTLGGVALLWPLISLWRAKSPDPQTGGAARFLGMPAAIGFAALFAGVVILVGGSSFRVAHDVHPQLGLNLAGWLAIALVAVVLLQAVATPAGRRIGQRVGTRVINSFSLVGVGVVVAGLVVLFASSRAVANQRNVRCGYDLPAIRDMMAYLKTVSQPGDVVFTDDWDVFPVYFFHNSYNNYIVGLDPKFTHSREPELWERYVAITRGQTPKTFTAKWTGPDGEPVMRKISVRLEDIRDEFRAKYVITDRDHDGITRQLAGARGFAELIYPKTSYEECKNAPYFIFKVLGGAATPPADDAPGDVYLSDLEPVSVDQGWGELTRDRSVSGAPIQLADGFHLRGLGTHTPLTLTYDVPADVTYFEAAVGINRTTKNRGSFRVIVEVDGREMFRSPITHAGDDPVRMRVPLGGGQRLTLRAEPTDDGNRWDHVDWADARFTRR